MMNEKLVICNAVRASADRAATVVGFCNAPNVLLETKTFVLRLAIGVYRLEHDPRIQAVLNDIAKNILR